MSTLAAGFSPDAVLSTANALLLGLISTCVAIVIAVMQKRSTSADAQQAATAWREQAEELSDRMERQNAAEIARLVQLIADRDRTIRELNRNRSTRGGGMEMGVDHDGI